ncbi:hypothetical protein FRB99_000398 [Tulasnella sp. 403]|nr:hypothetical protein FRB99_000398 [Tulasnella sp. 403]
MKVFAIGASRNIGYFSALKFLQQGHTVAFLLRKTNFTLKKGFFIHPPNLCTTALLNTLSAYPNPSSGIQPRFIVITSSGITQSSHDDLPCVMKPMYSVLLKSPHEDKLGMEKLLHHSSGSSAAWTEAGPKEEILAPGWEAKVGETGWLKHLVIIRPSFLTDGPETGLYQVGEDLKKRYTISRRDVAHFVAGALVEKWDEFEGRGVVIGY